MSAAIISVVIGLVALAIGGELLVRGAVGLARRLGISSLVTGLVIMGFATSMPEMVASVEAALLGSPEIAWGNIAGSNIANSLLILGATALIAPIALKGIGQRDAIVAAGVSALLLAIALLGLAGVWLGVALLAGLIVYIVWRYNHPRPADEEIEEGGTPPAAWLATVLTLGGVGALVVGGQFLISGAIDVARFAGLSETVIGLTVVAIGTSLPELAASAVAAFRGESDLAVGNVVGSNIFNILLIGGATLILAPGPVPTDLLTFDLPLVLGAAILIWALLAFGNRIGRLLGMLLVGGFAANTTYLLLA